jgi:hypothetical protein
MIKPAAASTRIKHRRLFRTSTHCASLVETYRDQVLTQKTRTIRLLGKKSSAKILHTLLGFEVQASYKRIQCPDMVTARYLKLFSELGCHSIKLPYDPTLTEKLIPEFEAMVEGLKEEIRIFFPGDPSTQRYVTRIIYAAIRRQLGESS